MGKDLNPPARVAVFGDPVAHSKSPQMHNPALEATGQGCQYIRFHIKPDDVREAFRALGPAGFIGTNVTVPHKGDAFAEVDSRTEIAERIGSVNTVLVDGDQLIGHNTDAPGMKRAIRENFAVDLSDLRIMIIGAGGGAGRAASIQCAMDRCERLVLANRTVEKVEKVKAEVAEFFDDDRLSGPADRLACIPWEPDALARELEHTDLIINATSVGMKASDPPVIPESLLQPHHLVYDMIYAPPRTRLIKAAEAVGARAANGLSMLLWQGALAFEFWFDVEPPIDKMAAGLKA
ncbi:MAG: shikimate dehydrogenase [Verrucomicrobiota bacterium]